MSPSTSPKDVCRLQGATPVFGDRVGRRGHVVDIVEGVGEPAPEPQPTANAATTAREETMGNRESMREPP